jgi:hypothetical protein
MTPIRSIASVQSYYFREAIAEAQLERTTLDDYRHLWRKAHERALTWRRRATTPFPAPAQFTPKPR